MRIYRVIILVLLVVGCTESASPPVVYCPQPIIDLGVVLPSKEAEAHFNLANHGSKSLEFSRVHSSCGCTKVQLSHQRLAKNENGSVNVTLNTDKLGPSESTITLITNDPKTPQLKLRLRYTVGDQISFSRVLLNTLVLKKGETGVEKFVIRSNQPQPPKCNAKVVSPTPEVVASVSMVNQECTVFFDSSNASAGGYSGVIEIQDDAGTKLSSIPWFIRIEDPIQLIPQKFLLSKAELGKRELQMVIDGVDDPSILAKRMDGQALELKVENREDRMAILTVQLPADFEEEQFILTIDTQPLNVKIQWEE